MNGSENYEPNRWTDDYEDPEYIAEMSDWRVTLCTCAVISGGVVAVHVDCPIHGATDPDPSLSPSAHGSEGPR